jgi:hypothetical protein
MWPSYDPTGLFRAHMHPGSHGRGLDTIQVNAVWIQVIGTIWIVEIIPEIYTSKVTVLIRHELDHTKGVGDPPTRTTSKTLALSIGG